MRYGVKSVEEAPSENSVIVVRDVHDVKGNVLHPSERIEPESYRQVDLAKGLDGFASEAAEWGAGLPELRLQETHCLECGHKEKVGRAHVVDEDALDLYSIDVGRDDERVPVWIHGCMAVLLREGDGHDSQPRNGTCTMTVTWWISRMKVQCSGAVSGCNVPPLVMGSTTLWFPTTYCTSHAVGYSLGAGGVAGGGW